MDRVEFELTFDADKPVESQPQKEKQGNKRFNKKKQYNDDSNFSKKQFNNNNKKFQDKQNAQAGHSHQNNEQQQFHGNKKQKTANKKFERNNNKQASEKPLQFAGEDDDALFADKVEEAPKQQAKVHAEQKVKEQQVEKQVNNSQNVFAAPAPAAVPKQQTKVRAEKIQKVPKVKEHKAREKQEEEVVEQNAPKQNNKAADNYAKLLEQDDNFDLDKALEEDLKPKEREEENLRISQVNEEIADEKLRAFRGLDLIGVNENKLVDFHKRKADLYSEIKEPTLMKDAFKVTASSEVFSETNIKDFGDLIHHALVKNLTQFMNFEKFTMIQSRAFKPIVEGKDVLIASETGSGKTLSYLLPVMQRIINFCYNESERRITRQDGTYAIILGPTRELCMQIYKVLHKLGNPFPWLVPGLLIGGEKTKSEKARLRKGVTVLVATPGRLNYHLKNTNNFNLSNLMTIVLDEADGIMDLGDEEQVKSIFMGIGSKVRRDTKPQAVLVSATLNSNIKRLANFTLRNEVYVGYSEEQHPEGTEIFKIPASLQQYYLISPRYLFLPLLVALLRSRTSAVSLSLLDNAKPAKMLVFLGTADAVEFYYLLFSKAPLFKNESDKGLSFPVPLFKLHSDMQTEERTRCFLEFSKVESGILFTTDVAARGLDFPGVDWIVQYDPPGEPKEYLHRIGRTARLGKTGNAVMFLSDSEILYLKLLEKFNLHPQKMNGLSLLEHLNLAFGATVAKSATSAVRHMFNIVANFMTKSKDSYNWACAAFLSFIRGYTSYYKDTRYIFHAKNLRMDHVKRMYGLTQKGRVLMKQKPEVGRIKTKLHEKHNKKSDIKDEAEEDEEEDAFVIDRRPMRDADEEIIESGDEDEDDLNDLRGAEEEEGRRQMPGGKQDNLVDINEFLEDYRDSIVNPTPSALPSIGVDESLQSELARAEKQKMADLETPAERSLKRDTPFGGTSKHMQMRLKGKTVEGSTKDIRKKEKYSKRLHDDIVVKGRTADAKRLAERNPFDVRGRGIVAKLTNSLSSEFDSGVADVAPAAKRRRLKQ